jgi:alpha-tubulin suppressor-like RCC1 family protein
MVAAGAEHTAAVAEDGELYGWGWGRYGNLGLGDRNDRLVPEKVSAVNVCTQYGITNFYFKGHSLNDHLSCRSTCKIVPYMYSLLDLRFWL